MQDVNRINKALYLLLNETRDSISLEYPERRQSIEKIMKHGVRVLIGSSLEINDYNSYLTSRIHEFAHNWLIGEQLNDLELKKIEEKRNSKLYKHYSREESFSLDETEYGIEGYREHLLDIYEFASWKEVEELIASMKEYSFCSR